MDVYACQKDQWSKELEALSGEEQEKRLKDRDMRYFKWFDDLLAKYPDTPRLLDKAGIRDVISQSFKHFDGIRYTLLAYTIMPNHVHVLILPIQQRPSELRQCGTLPGIHPHISQNEYH
jgi:hypothetical protein